MDSIPTARAHSGSPVLLEYASTPEVHRRLRGLIGMLCVGVQPQDLDDLYQETLIALIQYAPPEPPQNVSDGACWAILQRIARCRIYDRLRRQRAASRMGAELSDPPDPHSVSPLTHMEEQETREENHETAFRAMAGMSSYECLLLQRRLGCEDSFAKIARDLGSTHDAVKSKYHRALRRAREEINTPTGEEPRS